MFRDPGLGVLRLSYARSRATPGRGRIRTRTRNPARPPRAASQGKPVGWRPASQEESDLWPEASVATASVQGPQVPRGGAGEGPALTPSSPGPRGLLSTHFDVELRGPRALPSCCPEPSPSVWPARPRRPRDQPRACTRSVPGLDPSPPAHPPELQDRPPCWRPERPWVWGRHLAPEAQRALAEGGGSPISQARSTRASSARGGRWLRSELQADSGLRQGGGQCGGQCGREPVGGHGHVS